MTRLEPLRRAWHRIPVDTRWLIAIVLALASTVWLFVELSDEVLGQDTSAFDRSIVRALREPADPTQARGPEWLPQVARDVTSLGGMAVLVLVISAVTGFLALSKRFSSMWLVLISTVSGAGMSLALKNAFDRPRPDFVEHLDVTVTSSYPSGHAMLATVVYVTLGALLAQLTPRRRLKAYILCTALALAFLVGLTRVYLGVHYPTDVLGGWSAGIAWALCSGLVARLLRRRSPALKEEAQQGHDERVEEEAQLEHARRAEASGVHAEDDARLGQVRPEGKRALQQRGVRAEDDAVLGAPREGAGREEDRVVGAAPRERPGGDEDRTVCSAPRDRTEGALDGHHEGR